MKRERLRFPLSGSLKTFDSTGTPWPPIICTLQPEMQMSDSLWLAGRVENLENVSTGLYVCFKCLYLMDILSTVDVNTG